MENERKINPTDDGPKSSRAQKSLFVLKTNLNVNAISFASKNHSHNRPHSASYCNDGYMLSNESIGATAAFASDNHSHTPRPPIQSRSRCFAGCSHSNESIGAAAAASFASNDHTPFRPQIPSNCHAQSGFSRNIRHSHSNESVGPAFPRGLVMSCNPRIWRNISCRNLESSGGYDDNARQLPQHRSESNVTFPRTYRPTVLPNGILQLSLRDGIKIDITLDKAVRLTNNFKGIDVSVSSDGQSVAIKHPNGKVSQYGSNVEIVAFDGTNKNDFVRYAKFWTKGISFTSSGSALVYRLDAGGVRSTGDTLTDLMTEHNISTFLNDSRHGRRYFDDAMSLALTSTHTRTLEGTDDFYVNGFRITQKPFGVVKIYRIDNQCVIGMNSEHSSITLTTSEIHCTAAMRDTPHLFVRRDAQRLHFDGCCFLVRFEGNSAGFDDTNRLKVY